MSLLEIELIKLHKKYLEDSLKERTIEITEINYCPLKNMKLNIKKYKKEILKNLVIFQKTDQIIKNGIGFRIIKNVFIFDKPKSV